ncbi:MAG: hypothetical protein HY698_14160 [Deltaproteobacteria bacterium]|nr:hypothetical protein [Deltaproteobacteria bacterium]
MKITSLCRAHLVGALVLLLFSSTAWAKKRVVVLGFSGPSPDKAESAVQQLIESSHELVPGADYLGAKKRLGIKSSSDRDVARTCAELKADAVVEGSLKKKGKRWALTVVVREGLSGRTIDTITVTLPPSKAVDKAAARQLSKIHAAIETVVAIAEEPASPSSDPTSEESDPTPEPDEDSTESEDSESAGTEAGLSATTRTRRTAAAELRAGVSLVGRNMNFNYQSSVTTKPWGYRNDLPVAGVVVAAEVYPMAFGKRTGWMSAFGLEFTADKVVAIKSKLGDKELDTSLSRFGGGLLYRWNFGKGENGPTVKLGTGWERISFAIDGNGEEVDLPNVTYDSLAVGGGLRWPFGKKFAASTDVRYLLVMSTGDMEKKENYGGAGVSGLNADVGLEYALTPKLGLRCGFRITRFAYDFDGTGTKSTNRDTDPEQDVGGAVDRYMGGYLVAGYVF